MTIDAMQLSLSFGFAGVLMFVVSLVVLWIHGERKFEKDTRLVAAEYICQQAWEMMHAFSETDAKAARMRLFEALNDWQSGKYLG